MIEESGWYEIVGRRVEKNGWDEMVMEIMIGMRRGQYGWYEMVGHNR